MAKLFPRAIISLAILLLVQPLAQAAPTVTVRISDSATGGALPSPNLQVQRLAPGGTTALNSGAKQNARSILQLEPGRYHIAVSSPNYLPMSGDFNLTADYGLEIKLDPITPPTELRSENISRAQRSGYTLMQGYVTDEDSGQPLANATAASVPTGVSTRTDSRGFFRLYIPVRSGDAEEKSPSSLLVAKSGYRTEERQYLELSSGGDWTYRIRLPRGSGKSIVDERTTRRRSPKSITATTAPETTPDPADLKALTKSMSSGPHLNATAGSNATVRVPRNIRVLNQSSVVEYVTMDYYVKHSLPAEWISSWASFTGGSNSLNAGAVAVRCYAIAKLNSVNPGTNHDICATTSCQVYGNATSGATDTAADFTSNWVVVNGSGNIPSTEYSSENNQLGMACGDGYTWDPLESTCRHASLSIL